MANEIENKDELMPAETEAAVETPVEETAPATPEEEAAPAEESAPAAKSKRNLYMEGFRKKHPDWAEDDEEGFYGALSDDDAAREEEMNGYKSREEELSTALSGSPLNAALFLDAANGTPIPLSILKRYPNEVKAWMDDPENTEEIEKVFTDLADRMEKNKQLDEEAQKNLDETNALIDDMIAAGEIKDDEEANSLVEFLGKIALGLTTNHLEKDWLIAAKNAMNHDSDVEAARSEGEIAGRNAKITAQKAASKRGANNHSGMGSSNAGQSLSTKETRNATGNTGKRDMWAGMKTNKLS